MTALLSDTDQSALVADRVSVRIGAATLLRKVSLSAAPGAVLGLLGPNGAGKSTLLSLLAGDRRPDEGTVHLHGRQPHRWPAEALARVRAVMTQHTTVAFDFTVREVVALARLPHAGHTTAAQDRAIIAAALDMADATPLADRPYPGLSGGEKQRVQAARAFAQIWTATGDAPSRMLMLDEPTASLDLRHQHALLASVRRFVADGSAGAIVVLHDINLAATYCDHVALLNGGRLVACGPAGRTLAVDRLVEVYGVPLAAIDAGTGAPHFIVQPPAV